MATKSLRILWINCRLLHPLNGGDKLRTYHMLKELKARHRVTYLCLRTEADSKDALRSASEFCHELIAVPHASVHRGSVRFCAGALRSTIAGNIPYFVQRYSSPQAAKRIQEVCAAGEVDLIVCDYLASMIHLLELGRRRTVPIVLFQHNVESLLWKRRSACTRNRLTKFLYDRQARLTDSFEISCASIADGQVTVSEEEQRYLTERRRMTNVVGNVPTGVDFDYYQPGGGHEPWTVAFLGSMDWEANEDAVEYFTGEIYPSIKARVPAARFLVIGRNPSKRICRLGERDSSIEVTGTVRDVRPYLRRASLMVLPLRQGAGTRIKIFETMAMGLTTVSTRLGAEGLPVVDGETIVFAETTKEFADRIVDLLLQPDLNRRIGDNARRFVRAFGWAAAAEIFERYCLQVATRGLREN